MQRNIDKGGCCSSISIKKTLYRRPLSLLQQLPRRRVLLLLPLHVVLCRRRVVSPFSVSYELNCLQFTFTTLCLQERFCIRFPSPSAPPLPLIVSNNTRRRTATHRTSSILPAARRRSQSCEIGTLNGLPLKRPRRHTWRRRGRIKEAALI